MSKEIVKKESSEIVNNADMMAWGQEQAITSQDMVIAKILPLQQMSEKVINKEGEYGEFRDTANNLKFGDLESPFEFIPVLIEKKWIEFDLLPQKNGGVKREFKAIVNIQDNPTLEGYNDELAYSEEGLERDRVMDFYVLIPSEVEDGAAVPYVLSFKRTSLKAGKKLATQMYVRNRAAGIPPAGVVMWMSGVSKSNDEGTFVVADVKSSRAASQSELEEGFKWYQLIKGGQTKLDESDVAPKSDVPF